MSLYPLTGALWGWLVRLLPFASGLGSVGAVLLLLAWLLAEREAHVCLSYLELAGVSLLVSLALELARRAPPP